MKPIVRNAVRRDADAIFEMAEKLATSFVVESDLFRQVFHRVIKSSDATLLVAEGGSHLVGYLLAFEHPAFYANGSIAWVEELYVDENYRGRGIGSLLMGHFEQATAVASNKLVALATRRAGSFYQSIGYEASANYFKKHL
jgi:GNAT superfamily N-acetyltransferase